jgi:ribosome biogenesis protein Nip4
MRVLLKEEIRLFLIKVVKYQGDEIIDFLKDNKFTNCTYRLQRGRIFYSNYPIIAKARHFLKNKIGSIGICIGRFSKTGKFFILLPGQVFEREKILQKKKKKIFFGPFTLKKREKKSFYRVHTFPKI